MADFTDIIQEINENLPDNTTQAITAKKLRDTLIDLTDTIEEQQDNYEQLVDSEIEFIGDIVTKFRYNTLEFSNYQGQRVDEDGTISDSVYMDYRVYEVNPSNEYYFSADYYNTGITHLYIVNYFDENDVFISNELHMGETGSYNHKKLNVPSNAATIKMNVRRDAAATFKLDEKEILGYYDFSEMSDDIRKLQDVLTEYNYILINNESVYEGHRVDPDGSITESQSIEIINYTDIDSTNNYLFSCKYDKNGLTSLYLVNYFDNDVFVGNELLISETGIYNNYKLNVPGNCNTIKINARSTNVSSFSIKQGSPNGFFKINEVVDVLDKVAKSISRYDYIYVSEYTTIEDSRVYTDGTTQSSGAFDIHIYNGIDSNKNYFFSCSYDTTGLTRLSLVNYFAGDSFLGNELLVSETGTYEKYKLNVPDYADKIKINVVKSSSNSFVLYDGVETGFYNISDLENEIKNVESILTEYDAETIDDYTTIEGERVNTNGTTQPSGALDYRVYDNIDTTKTYLFSCDYDTAGLTSLKLVSYFNNEEFISNDLLISETGVYENYKLNVPEGTTSIKMNVVHSYAQSFKLNEAVPSGFYNLSKIESDIKELDSEIKYNDYEILDYEIELRQRIMNDGTQTNSGSICIKSYNGIDTAKTYLFSCDYDTAGLTSLKLINYFNGDTFLGNELLISETGFYDRYQLNVPAGTTTIKMNAVMSYMGTFSIAVKSDSKKYDFEYLNQIPKGSIKVKLIGDENIYLRSRYDDGNDILVHIGYLSRYNFFKNCLLPQSVYIGSKDYSDEELTQNGLYQRVDDCIGPVTMDFCGPIYANHGYTTPMVTISNNPLTSDDIGSIWHDQAQSLFGSSSGYREYTISNIIGNQVYLLPVIMGSETHERRDWVYYGSTAPTKLYHISGGTYSGDEPLNVSYSRFDYQVCECKDFKLTLDGKNIGINDVGVYYANDVILSYVQVCYDPAKITTWWPTPDYTNVPVQILFDRQFLFSSSFNFFSYSNNQKMNVLVPFDMGGQFTGNPDGHYIGTAPTAFLKNGSYDSYTFIPKVKYQYSGTSDPNDYAIDFRKEFLSNYKTHPAVKLYRNSTYLYDVDDMPERMYSYLKDGNNNAKWGVGGGHSLIRGTSKNSVKNNYTYINKSIGPWNPPVDNKLYTYIMSNGGQKTIDDYTTIEGERVNTNGTTQSSGALDYRVYANIDTAKTYLLSCDYDTTGLTSLKLINYFNGDTFLGNELLISETGSYNYVKLNVPAGTTTIKMNVVKSSSDSFSLQEVSTVITSDYIGMDEGFFCWYIPNMTNKSTGACIHTFYYASGDEYIVYIHTIGKHTKKDACVMPEILNGKKVDSIIEKTAKITLLDDVVVSGKLHISTTNDTDDDECNYIVFNVK